MKIVQKVEETYYIFLKQETIHLPFTQLVQYQKQRNVTWNFFSKCTWLIWPTIELYWIVLPSCRWWQMKGLFIHSSGKLTELILVQGQQRKGHQKFVSKTMTTAEL
jgi:hypothetical protein